MIFLDCCVYYILEKQISLKLLELLADRKDTTVSVGIHL